ncbi:MAG: hypothetical protein ACE5JX_04315 [Acidobacteriota bacterium]
MAVESERRRFYLDTSAYLCVLLNEDGGGRLMAEIEGAELVSSVLLVLEANRNLIRLARLGHVNAADLIRCLQRVDQDLDILLLRDLTLDLCSGREVPAVTTPRSLDLGHLRTALWFHRRTPLTRFVSLDQSQNQAARELDLPV